MSIFRIIFASVLLISPFPASPNTSLPFDPPWGPFRFIRDWPPQWVMDVVLLLTMVAAAMLLVGWFTRASSIAIAVLMVFSFGITYSGGKIDHTILFPMVPLALAFSPWGTHYSIDSLRGSSWTGQGWGHRLLALSIGVAFVTAALGKFGAGWLELDTQAARGHFLLRVLGGRHDQVTMFAVAVNWPPLWEVLDYATLIVEFGLLLAALHWPVFRVLLAVTVLFHFTILLIMGIAFYPNIVAYAAFVPWLSVLNRPSSKRFKWPVWLARWQTFRPAIAIALVLALGVASYLLVTTYPSFSTTIFRRTVVVASAAAAAAYLVWMLGRLFASIRTRLAVKSQPQVG